MTNINHFVHQFLLGDALLEVTPDIACFQDRIVNLYLVGDRHHWTLVDTGLFGSASRIRRLAGKRFGTKPESIVLTHGHFDHVGAVAELAKGWDVPVYAHALEMPYLTGALSYPPADPGVGGGMMARLSFLYPRQPIDLGDRVHPLPADGSLPTLPDWRWIHTPGHSAGHISLFRDRDRALIAGDAFVTVRQESAIAVLTQTQAVSRPPAYYTTDWKTAHRSVEILAAIRPEIAATGHGVPMRGAEMRAQLEALAKNFDRVAVPPQGHYVQQPVRG